MHRLVLVFVALLALSACQLFGPPAPPQTDVDAAVIARATTDQSSWISDRGSYREQRYSSSGRINERNLGRLELAWAIDLDGHSNQTPLTIDNTIYLTVPGKNLLAVDAATGSTLWKVSASGERAQPSGAGRGNGGMAIWAGNLYVTSGDGRLLAFDRRRGKLLWQSQVVQHETQFFTSPPRVVAGSIVISVGGSGEGGGYLAAYHADSGAEAWRYLPESSKAHGHEQESLQFLAYDGELEMLYLAVWAPAEDSELSYFNCPRLVAIQAQNGEYLWELPATASPVRICRQHATALMDLVVDGRMRSILIQSLGASGLNLVDRVTGQIVAVDSGTVVARSQKNEAAGETADSASCEQHNVRLPLSSTMAVDPINKLVFLGLEADGARECERGSSYLLAWDPLAREARWLVDRPDFTAGLLATGGNLLFEAAQSELVAYDSSSGEKRWAYPLEAASAPISYKINGRQYIAVVAAASESRRQPQLMVFTLAEPEAAIAKTQEGS